MMRFRRKKKTPLKVTEKQKYRDEILRIYVNCKGLDPVDLTREQQQYVSDVAKYWLLKHGCRTIHIQGGGDHFGVYAVVGIVLALTAMLVILYYLPV
jgi:hypothetical protein